MNRYHRQILLPQIGETGQRRLSASRIMLIGCGALGTVIAEQLVRAGIGHLRITDRDVVELTNLQRQTLFDESDVEAGLPKAIAATGRLSKINSAVAIEPKVVDVHSENIEALCDSIDLILDGTDNVQTRYLINDIAVKLKIPWVYGACVGVTGRAMGIIPEKSPCLRCLFPEPPGPGELQTCDTAGVLASASAIVASLQVAEAFKILLNDADAAKHLTTFDLWLLRFRSIDTTNARHPECITCGEHRFEFLAQKTTATSVLCGRETVQIRPPSQVQLDLPALASQMQSIGTVQTSSFFVRCAIQSAGLTLTLFPDGRALIHGTSDPAVARSAYAKYVGI